jgi:transposase
MRKPSSIELTDQQRSALLMWVATGKSEQRLVKRAQVILCAAAGIGLKEMETKAGLSWQSCLKWRKRFVKHGLKGLRDIPRKGRPASITPKERVHVMALANFQTLDAPEIKAI